MSKSCPLTEDIIVIDDNYTGICAGVYASAGKKIDEILQEYIEILTGLVDRGEFCGAAADSLYEFARTARELLGGTAELLGLEKERYMNAFVTEIDAADKEVY